MINVIKTIHYIDIVLPIVNVTIIIFFLFALVNLFTVLKNKDNSYYLYSLFSFIISIILGISLIFVNHYYKKLKNIVNDVKDVVNNFKTIVNDTSSGVSEFYNNLNSYLSSTFPDKYKTVEEKINDIFNIFLSRYGNMLNKVLNYIDIVIKMF
jgi:predicted PurR-regulated permease PerM